MKTSKIKAIQANGTYKSNYGLLYKFEYEMEDGTVINANHKTMQSPFNDGDEVEYEIKGSKDGFTWGSVKKPEGEFKKDDGVQLYIIRQSSLKVAIDHLSHKDHDSMTKENVTALAEYYTNYVLHGNE